MEKYSMREMGTFYSQVGSAYEAMAGNNKDAVGEWIHGAEQTSCALSNNGVDVTVMKEVISMAKQALVDMGGEDDSK